MKHLFACYGLGCDKNAHLLGSSFNMCLIVYAFIYSFFCFNLKGANRFYENIVDMVGYRPFPWFKYCWKFTLPGMTLVRIRLSK